MFGTGGQGLRGCRAGERGGGGTQGVAGLEDVGADDFSVPRLKIMQRESRFKLPDGTELGELDCILLGQIKQRIMWFKDLEDKDKPQCKSPDFSHGFPNMGTGRPQTHFPFRQAGIDPARLLPIEEDPSYDWTATRPTVTRSSPAPRAP